MSLRDDPVPFDVRARPRARAARRLVFGDSVGLVVFLVAVVVLGALWRVDFIMNDSVTVGNLLVNVADGRLAVTDAPYALTAGEQPGLVEVNGRLYGRNYGQVYLAVPLLWALDVLASLVDLRLLLAAGWSLAVVALATAVARLTDRPLVATVGAGVGLVAFGASMVFATDIGWLQQPRPVVALGLSTLLLAAVAASLFSRLLARFTGPTVGLAGGLTLVLATPLGFWGSFPKRHVLSATVLVLLVFLFAVSRRGTDRRSTLARAGAYAAVGLFTSVHAFEAAFAFAVLVPFDLLTAPSNDRRTLAVVALVFALSLTPMLATNAAISGDPLQPPRTLPGAEGGLSLDPGEVPVEGAEGAAGGGGGGSSSGGSGGSGSAGGVALPRFLAPLFDFVDRILWIGNYMLGALVAGLAAVTEPQRLFHVLVRSGWIPSVSYHRTAFETLELAMLETLPLAGALLALPSLAVAGLRRLDDSLRAHVTAALGEPDRQTDLFAGALALTLFLVYLPRLPLNAMLTLRYVVPVMPLLLYGVFRLVPVRTAVTGATRTVASTYAVTVAVGTVATWLALGLLDPAVGEAVQLHALAGLSTGLLVAGVLVSWPFHRRVRPTGACLALAAGTTTVYLLFAALTYFPTGGYALDLVRMVAGFVPVVG